MLHSLLFFDNEEVNISPDKEHKDHGSQGQLIVPEWDGKEVLILKILSAIRTGNTAGENKN